MELTSSVQARHRGPRSSSRCSAHDRTHHAEDSLTRGRIVGGLAAAGVLLVGVAGNAQYMFVSTFRVKNDSAPAPVHVSLSLDQVRGSRHVRTVRLEPDTATTGWLRFTGEATLRAEATGAGGKPSSACTTYIESGHYHVDINVDAGGRAHCWLKIVSPLDIGLMNVIP
jgi:hypothetical protein